MIWGDPSAAIAVTGALSGALLAVSLASYLATLALRLVR